MELYDDSLTVKEGLKKYFLLYNLADGGYNSPVFKIKIRGPLKLVFPNIKARVNAVKLHDIHHVLNEFETKLKGEAEIGAWEIGSGCGKYYAAWLLNFGAILYGIFIWPRMTFRAFIKGRNCLNLYHGIEYNDQLLNTSVGTLRKKLRISQDVQRIRFNDILSYSFWVILCLLVIIFPFAVIFLAKILLFS
jgi:hypothetical protein